MITTCTCTWTADFVDHGENRRGPHHSKKCPMWSDRSLLSMSMYSNGTDWVMARDEPEARRVVCDDGGLDTDEVDEFHLVADSVIMLIREEDGTPSENIAIGALIAREYAAVSARGGDVFKPVYFWSSEWS